MSTLHGAAHFVDSYAPETTGDLAGRIDGIVILERFEHDEISGSHISGRRWLR